MRRRKRFWIPFLLFLTSPAIGQAALFHQWSNAFGDTIPWTQAGYATAVDAAGGTVVTGEFSGTVDFGGGPLTAAGGFPPPYTDVFLARFDAGGNHIWSKRYGEADDDGGVAVTLDASSNVFISGRVRSSVDFGGGPLTSAGGWDAFLAKLDANGNHIWSKRFGDISNQYGGDIVTDALGNVILTGVFEGTIDFGGGPLVSAGGLDIYVAKFDASGNHLWSRRSGNVVDQHVQSVCVDGAGNLIVTGYFEGSMNLGGSTLVSAGHTDIFLAKLDPSGADIWGKRFGAISVQEARSVDVDGAGNIFITGYFFNTVNFGGGTLTSQGATDIFLAKFDPSGSHVWSQRFGDDREQVAYAMALDGSGHVVVTGYLTGSTNFGGGPLVAPPFTPTLFVARFDANGAHDWSDLFDGASGESHGIAANGSGRVAMTGNFNGTVDFGGGPLTSQLSDIFVATFRDDAPVPVLVTSFEAIAHEVAVDVRWDLHSDETLERYTLYRTDVSRTENIVVAEGDPAVRSYRDTHVEPSRSYEYQLAIRTVNGSIFRSPVATATVPMVYATLGQNFPNPFNPRTTISVSLARRFPVAITIYDPAGRFVAKLNGGTLDAGTHHVEWDGRDGSGRSVSSGVYFYRLENTNLPPRKMTLLK